MRDLRGVEALDLDLRDGFDRPLSQVVIVGPNGSGKTTALEAIVLALGRSELLPDDSADLDAQVRFGAHDFEISLVLETPDSEEIPTNKVDQNE